MFKIRFPMNLQLFAGVNGDGVDPEDLGDDPAPGPDADTPVDDDDDIRDLEAEFDEEDGDSDVDPDEDEDPDENPADDPQDDPAPADDKSKGKDNPTAAAVIAERRKWQEKQKALEAKAALADKIMKQSGVADIKELEARMDAIETERLKKQGVDPQLAAAMVAQQRQLVDTQSAIRKLKYDGEVERLKQDAFFADVEDHRDELEEFADKTGLTIEQAYRALHGARRQQERDAEIEARVKANREKRDGKRVNTNPTAGTGKRQGNTLNLTPDQLAAAKYGVKKGHFKSIEEYAKLLR